MGNKNGIPGIYTIKVSGLAKSRARACIPCREGKRKCSQDRPSCTYCLKHGHECIYESDLSKNRRYEKGQTERTVEMGNCQELSANDKDNTKNRCDHYHKLVTLEPDIHNFNLSMQRNFTFEGSVSSPRSFIRTTKHITPISMPRRDRSLQIIGNDSLNDSFPSFPMQSSISNVKHPIQFCTTVNEPERKRPIVRGLSEILNKDDNLTSVKKDVDKRGGVSTTETSASSIATSSSDTTPLSSPNNSHCESKIHHLLEASKDLVSLSASTAECKTVDNLQAASTGFFPFHQESFPRMQSTPEVEVDVQPKDRKGTVFTNILNSSLFKSAIEPREDLTILLDSVPDRKTCDNLLHRYSVSVHPIIPILDCKNFYLSYESFWNDPSSATLPFYIELFTILYCASVVKYEEDALTFPHEEIRKRLPILKKYVGCAEIALSMYKFPRNITIEGLQATVILHSVLRNDCRTNDSGSVGALVRLAQTVELNRDPLKYHGIADMGTVQRRRILWWQLVYLDVTTSLSNRLSPIISGDTYDTQFPSEYVKDCHGCFVLDQPIAFLNGRFRWAECTNKILHNAFNLKPLTDTVYHELYDEIENLSFYTTSLIQRVMDPANTLPAHERFTSFSASILSTLPDRAYLLLYIGRTRKGNKNAYFTPGDSFSHNPDEHIRLKGDLPDSSSIGNIRIEKLDEELIEHQIHLLSEFIKYGEMPNHKLFLWDIRKFQPIQAMLSLIKILLIQAKGIQAQNKFEEFYKHYDFRDDEKVKVIDKAIEKLSYLSVHTTKLCKNRWQLLKNLRCAVWEQLGVQSNRDVNYDLQTVTDSLSDEDDIRKEGHKVSESDWRKLLEDLDKLEDVVDENINIKVWDQKAGNYLT